MSPIIVVWLSRTCCRCSFCRRLICFLWNYRNRQMELNSSRMLGQNNKCGDESEEWKEDAHVRGHVRFINVTVAHDYCFFFFPHLSLWSKKMWRPENVQAASLGFYSSSRSLSFISWCAPCGLPPSAPAASHAPKVWKSHISVRLLHRAHSAGYI